MIEKVGTQVSRFQPGDQVFGITGFRFGAYAEYVCLSEDEVLAPKPDGMGYEESAVLSVGGLNALHFMRLANIRKGTRVLIYGGSGSIGTYAVQIARHFGAEVTVVCRMEHFPLMKELGAAAWVDYTKEDFSERGETWDVIFDPIGKSPYTKCIKSLTSSGVYLLGNPSLFDMVSGRVTSLFGKRKVIAKSAKESVADLLFLKQLAEEGVLISVMDRRYPLERISEAHAYVDQGMKTGNVAITVHGGA